jgi:hypothetical protein
MFNNILLNLKNTVSLLAKEHGNLIDILVTYKDGISYAIFSEIASDMNL